LELLLADLVIAGTVTRSPFFQRVTCLPVASTVPASSCPGTCGSTTSGSCPIQPCQSLRHRPVASTLITTPSAEGVGSGTFCTRGGCPNCATVDAASSFSGPNIVAVMGSRTPLANVNVVAHQISLSLPIR